MTVMLFGQCAYCGRERHLNKDHVVPVSKGGTDWPTNILWVCVPCNQAKKNAPLEEFRHRRYMRDIRKETGLPDRLFWFEIEGNRPTSQTL